MKIPRDPFTHLNYNEKGQTLKDNDTSFLGQSV